MHTATKLQALPGLAVPAIRFGMTHLSGVGPALAKAEPAPPIGAAFNGKHRHGGQAEKVEGNLTRRRARNKVAARSRRVNRSGR